MRGPQLQNPDLNPRIGERKLQIVSKHSLTEVLRPVTGLQKPTSLTFPTLEGLTSRFYFEK